MTTLLTASDRSALEARLELLLAKNRAMTADVHRNAEKIQSVEAKLRETVEAVEREEDHLANSLLRQIDAVRREKDALMRDLRDEEMLKTEREKKLAKLKTTSKALMGVLKEEEDGLRHRLLAQLSSAQQRRQLLEKKLRCESATLHELALAVRQHSHTDPTTEAAFLSDQVPDASKEQVTDSAMLHHLQHEIHSVQQLRSEAQDRIKLYTRKRHELEAKMGDAVASRQAQRESVDWMKTELARTHELSANSEVLAEWAADREFFCNVKRRHRTSSQASSVSTRTTVDTSEVESTPRVLHGGGSSLHK